MEDPPVPCDPSDLCREIADDPPTSEYRTIYGTAAPRRIVMESERFVVLCDFAPLVVGHVLLAPREHLTNFALLPPDSFVEALALLDDAVQAIAHLGDVQVAEHGSVPGHAISACITHAHWHLLPGVSNLAQALRSRYNTTELGALPDLATATDGSSPYYLVASTEAVTIVSPAAEAESQLIRKLVAGALGLAPGLHDWSVYQDKELFAQTLKLFR